MYTVKLLNSGVYQSMKCCSLFRGVKFVVEVIVWNEVYFLFKLTIYIYNVIMMHFYFYDTNQWGSCCTHLCNPQYYSKLLRKVIRTKNENLLFCWLT